MKKLTVTLSIALLVLGASSCKKLVDKIFPGIDTKLPDIQLTIPIAPIVLPNENSLGSFSTRINFDSTIRANTGGLFGIDAVSSIKVKEIAVSLTNPDDLNNLSNFETSRITLAGPGNSSPTTLATFNFPDTYASSLTVTPTDSPELLPYLKGSEIVHTVYGKGRRPTTKPLNFVVSVTLRVK